MRPLVVADSQGTFTPTDNCQSDEDDFTGAVQSSYNHSEENKLSSKEEEKKRLDRNVEAYEKKLSAFERMFLFINDDLDFNQLGEMAQEVERHRVTQLS